MTDYKRTIRAALESTEPYYTREPNSRVPIAPLRPPEGVVKTGCWSK